MSTPLQPSASLLSKLGSIVVHVEEMLSPDGHYLDRSAIEGLLKDVEVREWIASMRDLAMLPLKRLDEQSTGGAAKKRRPKRAPASDRPGSGRKSRSG